MAIPKWVVRALLKNETRCVNIDPDWLQELTLPETEAEYQHFVERVVPKKWQMHLATLPASQEDIDKVFEHIR